MPNEAKRDPRTNPKPGDVLRKKYQGQYFESRGYNERHVYNVAFGGGLVVYTNIAGGGHVRLVQIKSWIKWAKGAKVIHAAD